RAGVPQGGPAERRRVSRRARRARRPHLLRAAGQLGSAVLRVGVRRRDGSGASSTQGAGRVRAAVLAVSLCAASASADALQMEYDYGLTQSQLEAALLLYYTPLPGTQVHGVPKPYAPG